MDERTQARNELEALSKVPGALRIITNEVHPDLRMDRGDPRSQLPEGSDADLLSPSTFVIHDVVRIVDHPSREGALRAYSAEGDFCEGYPEALIVRLRAWRG
jgi:hypothetical protein